MNRKTLYQIPIPNQKRAALEQAKVHAAASGWKSSATELRHDSWLFQLIFFGSTWDRACVKNRAWVKNKAWVKNRAWVKTGKAFFCLVPDQALAFFIKYQCFKGHRGFFLVYLSCGRTQCVELFVDLSSQKKRSTIIGTLFKDKKCNLEQSQRSELSYQ